MAANISIPSLSNRSYRPVAIPKTTDLYGPGGPGSDAGMNMMNNVLTSNAALGQALTVQAMKDKSALTLADMNNAAALERTKLMYKGPTLFDKLKAISSMFDTQPIGNPNLANGNAIGLQNSLQNVYNDKIAEHLGLELDKTLNLPTS
tara:strand:- start:8097 stop:8540 length:444 start_codon:yes stop_codon:yes gene_type:complete